MTTSKIRAAGVWPPGAEKNRCAWLLFGGLRWLLALWLGLGCGAGAWATNAWQQTGGPLGGEVHAVAVDPLAPSTVYAGTSNSGVYKSTDGGTTWALANAGMGSAQVESLLVDPATPTTLYAGGSGVYKSLDAGATWAQVASSFTVQSMASDPGAPAVLYVGTTSHGMQKSTDGGASWAPANTGLGSSYVAAVAVDPVTPATVYAGTSGGAYKSVDAGATWAPVGAGLPATYVNAIAINPATPSTVYAGLNNGYAYKSIDGGASWTQTGGALPGGAYRIFIDPANGSDLYVRTAGGLYKSVNAGANWSYVGGQPLSHVWTLAFDPANSATMYAGTSGAGVFKSGDGGVSWAAASSGVRASSANVVLVDPAAPTTLYAATLDGVAKSLDAGASWTAAGLSPYRVHALALDPSTPGTMYAGTATGLFKTVNAGAIWTQADAGIPSYSYITALAVNPSTPATLFAGTSSHGLYRSINGGAGWAAPASGLPGTGWVNFIAIDPVTPATVYTSVGGNVFKSVDGGVNWAAVGGGLPSGQAAALAIHPLTPSTLHVLTLGGGMFKSTDGGGAWASTGSMTLSGAKRALVVNPATPTTIYAVGDTVWKSTDGGVAWAEASSGLADAGGTGYVQSLAIDPQTPTTLYAGTINRGVYKSTNGAVSSGPYLAGLELALGGSPVALSPSFSRYAMGPYAATVLGAASATVTPTAELADATITVNGTSIASGSASAPVALSPGANTFSVVVASGDGTSSRNYTLTVTRQVVVPTAPTNVQAQLGAPGSGQATVSWTPGASSGSSAWAGYAVTGGNGCNAGPGDSSCTVSGLVNGTAYSFTVTAANAEGASATSGPSNSVTPLGAQAIAFGNPGPQSFGTTPTLSATGGASGQPVTFTASPAGVCMIAVGGQLAFMSAGNCTVTAHQAGTAAYAAAPAVSQTFAVMAVPPSAPANVIAKPIGATQATVSWTSPASDGGGITQYTVRALINGQPSGQICTTAPPATNCTLTGLAPGVTYTFTVEAINGAGSTASPAPSNPVTPLVNPKEFSGAAPTGTGTVAVTVAGGGATCGFESVRLISPGGAVTPPPENLHFPHGLLDFVLAGCDTTNVTLTITYPDVLPPGVQYWKLRSGSWAPYAGATAGAGTTTATVVLKDGGPGDDDGNASNGRIVDPGGAGALLATGPGGAAAIPTLSDWALVVMAGLLGVLGLRQKRPA